MSLFLKFTNFTNDAAGLEKTLRFLQALTQILAPYTQNPVSWLHARAQIALSRRYFRLLKWVDAFRRSYAAFLEMNGIVGLLEALRLGFLGLYFLLEMVTILHAMGLLESEWAPKVILEANRFWFYSICLGHVVGVVKLWELGIGPPSIIGVDGDEKKDEKKSKAQEERRVWKVKRGEVVKKLLIDGCDILIPGSVTGWLVVSSANVGMASVVSTVLASVDIWERVQNAS